MKIAISQINYRIGAFEKNLEKILSQYRDAQKKGADLIVFPELALSGYPPQDLLERREFIEAQEKVFERLVKNVNEVGVILGHFSENISSMGKPLFSSVSLIANGKVLHTTHKRLLPAYDIFDETRYFEPGSCSSPVEFNGLRLGLTVCEDIWTNQELCPECRYSEDPVSELIEQGIDVLINVSASPFHLGKFEQRIRIANSIVTKSDTPLVYCNSVGGQDCLVFDGASFVMDENGHVFSQLPAFKEDLAIVDLDAKVGPVHAISTSHPEQAFYALKMALVDYMDRCGFKDVVVGLSGGIDSSLTASIAQSALGPERVLGVLMPSEFTSQESIEDALALAKNLGIKTHIVPIKEMFDAYIERLSPVFKDAPWNVTEENLQARIRGNILMAISNKFGHLVLSTGNKSELAVGYCTLYGDLSGGFSLISDCPKSLVYEIAEFINREKEIIPQRVIEKPPTAELRPGQRDEDDLPPYSLLDKVLKAYIEDGMTVEEIVNMGVEREVVERIVRMIIKSEYKRRQAPMGPRITSKALCCGRRWPVCHGFKVGD